MGGGPAAGLRRGAACGRRPARYGETWNEAQTEEEFVKPVLDALGWSYIVQAKNSAQRPPHPARLRPVRRRGGQGRGLSAPGRRRRLLRPRRGHRRGQVLGPAAQPAGRQRPQHLEGRQQPQPPDGQLPGGHALPVGHPHQRPHLAPLQPRGQQHRQRVLRGRPGADLRLPRSGRRPHARATGRLQALVALLPPRRLPARQPGPLLRAAGPRGLGHLRQARQRQAEGAGLRRGDAGDRRRLRGLPAASRWASARRPTRACGRSTRPA